MPAARDTVPNRSARPLLIGYECHASGPQGTPSTQELQRRHGLSMFDRVTLLNVGVQLPVFAVLFQAVRRVAASGGAFYWVSSLARPDAMVAAIAATCVGASVGLNATSRSSAAPRYGVGERSLEAAAAPRRGFRSRAFVVQKVPRK